MIDVRWLWKRILTDTMSLPEIAFTVQVTYVKVKFVIACVHLIF